jgi:hypothetical protein
MKVLDLGLSLRRRRCVSRRASEGSGKWSRNIPGIDGALDAIQANAGIPVL